jgi:hypothetical protein
LDVYQRPASIGAALERQHLAEEHSVGRIQLDRRPDLQRAFTPNQKAPSSHSLDARLEYRPGLWKNLEAQHGIHEFGIQFHYQAGPIRRAATFHGGGSNRRQARTPLPLVQSKNIAAVLGRF